MKDLGQGLISVLKYKSILVLMQSNNFLELSEINSIFRRSLDIWSSKTSNFSFSEVLRTRRENNTHMLMTWMLHKYAAYLIMLVSSPMNSLADCIWILVLCDNFFGGNDLKYKLLQWSTHNLLLEKIEYLTISLIQVSEFVSKI